MDSYQVGQILYLMSGNKVLPIQVYEEVIRTTIHGKEKTYIIKLPDGKSSSVDIKKIKGQIFKSTDEVRNHMVANAKNAINEMIKQAGLIASDAFSHSHVETPVKQDKEDQKNDVNDVKVQPEKERDIIKVDLGNGKFGKMSVDSLKNAGVPQ